MAQNAIWLGSSDHCTWKGRSLGKREREREKSRGRGRGQMATGKQLSFSANSNTGRVQGAGFTCSEPGGVEQVVREWGREGKVYGSVVKELF